MPATVTGPSDVSLQEFVFAIVSVSSAAAAGRPRGDLEIAAILRRHYELVAAAVAPAAGRVVKVLGDGVLLVFPIQGAKMALDALRSLQSSGSRLWSEVDPRCHVQVKAGAGSLAAGSMGPPGDQHFDVYGKALNELFKMPASDFVITPALTALL